MNSAETGRLPRATALDLAASAAQRDAIAMAEGRPRRCARVNAMVTDDDCRGRIRAATPGQPCAECAHQARLGVRPGQTEEEKPMVKYKSPCAACRRESTGLVAYDLCGTCYNRHKAGRLKQIAGIWVFRAEADVPKGAVRIGLHVGWPEDGNRTELPQDRAEASEADKDSHEGGNAQPDQGPSAAAGCSVPEPEVETRLIHAADHLGPKEEPQPANPDPFAGLDFEVFSARRGGEKLIAPAVSVTNSGDLTFNVPATRALNSMGVERVRLYVSRCPSGALVVGIKGVGPDEPEDGAYRLSHTGGSSTGRRIACRAFSLQNGVLVPQAGMPLLWSESQKMWCAEIQRQLQPKEA